MKTANITDDIIKPAQDRADCNLVSCGDLEWTARQNDRYGFKLSDVLIPVSYKSCEWIVDGKVVKGHPEMGTAANLGQALLVAFRERRVRLAADRLGLAVKQAKHSLNDTWYVVDPQDEEASVEVCFYDGYCHIAGNQARVKNVSVANLVKHLSRKMAHARHMARQAKFQEECETAYKAAAAAFTRELHSLGVKSNDRRTLKFVPESCDHVGEVWTFVLEYRRTDDSLRATIKASDAATVQNKVAILDTF
jgi:hypothetical protein